MRYVYKYQNTREITMEGWLVKLEITQRDRAHSHLERESRGRGIELDLGGERMLQVR